MSRCYYIKSEDGFINLEAVQENLQGCMAEGYTVKLDEYERSEGEGGCLYIEGEAARGVHVFKEDDNIVVKINSLCNYPDYLIAKIILDMLNQVLEKDIIDEEENIINPQEYFTDEKIQELREADAKTVYVALKNIVKDNMQIFGVVRKVYFGKDITAELSKYEDEPAALVKIFEMVMNHVQYELPDYKMPGAAMIRPKDSDNEDDFKLIRMMFEGNDYILQDYDFLFIRPDENTEEVVFIDNSDLMEILPEIYTKKDKFEVADDYTVVFPKLEGKKWQKFIELAREKNHKELLEAVPAAKTVNLTPDYDPESEENDETSNQCHGNHWDCILNKEKEFEKVLPESLEKSTLYGQTESDYILESKLHGQVSILEYDGGSEGPIVVRNVIAENEEKANTLASGYPVVKDGILLPLKIIEIKEWTNGLEAWITAELPNENEITFFDADYALNKNKYEIGKSYDFIIGALAYYASEPESKGFKFEGQQAIDFKAKLGEEPEYDEDGNVKPIEFSTASLCSFFQVGHAPDEAEFITTVEDVSSVKAFGKQFWKFDVIYRGSESDETYIPTFVLKEDENKKLNKATQIQGLLWVTGYLAK